MADKKKQLRTRLAGVKKSFEIVDKHKDKLKSRAADHVKDELGRIVEFYLRFPQEFIDPLPPSVTPLTPDQVKQILADFISNLENARDDVDKILSTMKHEAAINGEITRLERVRQQERTTPGSVTKSIFNTDLQDLKSLFGPPLDGHITATLAMITRGLDMLDKINDNLPVYNNIPNDDPDKQGFEGELIYFNDVQLKVTDLNNIQTRALAIEAIP
jgi:hypothetical protein